MQLCDSKRQQLTVDRAREGHDEVVHAALVWYVHCEVAHHPVAH
jgi:hypothetical protein